MAVTDLTGTTWLINSTTTTPSSTIWKSINFTSNSMSFDAITIYDDMDNEQVIAYRGAEEFPTIVYSWGWTNEAYRTIVITGGADATDQTLIAWLEANAENITPATPDVVISYNGSEIASMTESGAKTLKTGGKYCANDITVAYTKPEGGGGSEKLYIFTESAYTKTNAVIGSKYLPAILAYHSEALQSGVTITFYTYNDYILDTITGDSSGTTYPFTTVTRGQYTFTMPDESIYCALLYND